MTTDEKEEAAIVSRIFSGNARSRRLRLGLPNALSESWHPPQGRRPHRGVGTRPLPQPLAAGRYCHFSSENALESNCDCGNTLVLPVDWRGSRIQDINWLLRLFAIYKGHASRHISYMLAGFI